jgi:hypothetical protein
VLAPPLEGYPSLEVQGSHGEIGFALGARMRGRHRDHLALSRSYPDCLAYLHGRGGPHLERLLGHSRERFPHLVEELEGMAAGLEMPFMELFAHLCRSEIGVAVQTPGCSTLAHREAGRVLLAHNEDGDELDVGRAFLVRVHPPSGIHFDAFVYPGLPPCNAPGINACGIVQTTNYIQPWRVADGVPRYFFGRAVLEAPDLDEAVALATSGPRAFPWHHNLASLREGRLLSVEVMPEHHCVHEVEGSFVHTNHLVHPEMVAPDSREKDRPYESSLTRWRVLNAAIAARGAPTTRAEMLALLSSHAGRPFSPCRHPEGEIHGATLATAVFSGPPPSAVLYHGNPCLGRRRPWVG